MATYKVKSFSMGNGNNIHKAGDILEESAIIGGEARARELVKQGFLTIATNQEKPKEK